MRWEDLCFPCLEWHISLLHPNNTEKGATQLRKRCDSCWIAEKSGLGTTTKKKCILKLSKVEQWEVWMSKATRS